MLHYVEKLFTGENVLDPLATIMGHWSSSLNIASILFRVCLAFLLAAIVGCERSNKRHSAGLRTFILVTLASTTAMLIDCYMINTSLVSFPLLSTGSVIAVAIISTYSILFSSRSQIKGLTTAAGLWTCSLVGSALGCGFYTVALVGFFAVIACLSLLPALERYLKDRSNHFEIHLELADKRNLREFTATIRKLGLRIDDIELNPAYATSGLGVYSVSLTIVGPELKKYKTHREIIEALATLDYVYHVEEIL